MSLRDTLNHEKICRMGGAKICRMGGAKRNPSGLFETRWRICRNALRHLTAALFVVGKIKNEKTKWKEGEPPGLLGGGKIFSFQVNYNSAVK